MARNDDSNDIIVRLSDLRDGKIKGKDIAKGVKDLIAVKLAEKYADDPTRFAKLVEVGLIDESTLRRLPDGVSFDDAIKQFRDRIAEMAREQPSVLQQLEVRPLDVLTESSKQEAQDRLGDQIAVVFSDLEGFTSFTSQRGDHEASAMLRDHYDVVDSIVRGRGGAVVKTIGDGHMLSFGEPRAAVLAGVELAELDTGPLAVRVGGHNGPVVSTGDDLLGHVVNVAARVADTAAGGETVVTTSLRDGAGPVGGILFEDPQAAKLKGIDEPFEVCRVRHEPH
jgi:adenylate cyclase